MAHRIAWLRKKVFENFSSTLFFGKTKKKIKLTSKFSLTLSFKDDLRLKQKTTLFSDSDKRTRY